MTDNKRSAFLGFKKFATSPASGGSHASSVNLVATNPDPNMFYLLNFYIPCPIKYKDGSKNIKVC